VSQSQSQNRTSGLYGARENLHRQTDTDRGRHVLKGVQINNATFNILWQLQNFLNKKLRNDGRPVWIFKFFNHIIQVIPKTSQPSDSS